LKYVRTDGRTSTGLFSEDSEGRWFWYQSNARMRLPISD